MPMWCECPHCSWEYQSWEYQPMWCDCSQCSWEYQPDECDFEDEAEQAAEAAAEKQLERYEKEVYGE